jgi:hypothetical protein
MMRGMCAQCMSAAVTAGAAATGLRAWLAAKARPWLSPRALKVVTAVLLAGAVVASGLHT